MALFSGEEPVLGDRAGYVEVFVASLPGATAATAANYGSIFTANRPCQILEVAEIHETAGTDAGAVTLDLTKDTGTNAPGAGSSVFTSGTFNLKGTANTVVVKLADPGGVAVLARGDRLGLKDTGTLTSVAGLQVSVVVRWLPR